MEQKRIKRKERYCKNCHYPVPFYGRHCSNCGQKYREGPVRLGQLLGEFIDTVFNLDNRLFRTMAALLIPAKLTLEYFAGRQKRYIQPLRLFFVLAVIHLASVSFFGFQSLEEDIADGIDQQSMQGHYVAFMKKANRERDSLLEEFKHIPDLKIATDRFLVRLQDQEADSTGIFYLTKSDAGWVTESMSIDAKDVYTMERDSLFEKYKVPKGWARFQANQFIKVIQKGDSFVRQAVGQLVWMYILLLPTIALFMKLLYIRRKRYFVEHLTFNFHFHAFIFAIGAITWALLGKDMDSPDVYLPILFGVGFLYLFIAMKRYYKQGWFKTFVKFCIYNFIYLTLWIWFLVLTFAASALTF